MNNGTPSIAPVQGLDPAADWVRSEIRRLIGQPAPIGQLRSSAMASVSGPPQLLNRVFGTGLKRPLGEGQSCCTAFGITLVQIKATSDFGVPDVVVVMAPAGRFLLPVGMPGLTAEEAAAYRERRLAFLATQVTTETPRAVPSPAPQMTKLWPDNLPRGRPPFRAKAASVPAAASRPLPLL